MQRGNLFARLADLAGTTVARLEGILFNNLPAA